MSTVAIGSIAAAGIGAAGSLISGQTQANAAERAQNLQAQEAQNSLDFQKMEFAVNQGNEAPFLHAGTQAVNELAGLTGTPGQGLLAPWTGQFQAPTAAQAAATPGYQFQLQQGEQALQNSAAAKGGLLSGGTAKALDQYSQGLASTDYQQTYNNAFNEYQQSYNQFQNNQANEFNRLSALSGGGQTSATTLGQQGQQTAGNVANINLTTGAQQGQDIQNAAAATASGYAGATNAATGALGNIGSMMMLQQLLSGGGAGNNAQLPGYG